MDALLGVNHKSFRSFRCRFGRYKERGKNYRIEKTAVFTAVFRLNLHFTIIVDIYI